MRKKSDDILILDDEENYAEMIASLLQNAGYRTDVRTSPGAALEALKNRSYSLVVSDYKMPDLDGAEFLRRARELHANLPVIMISGFMNTPELLKVANMGVTLVLEKPFDTQVFLENVSRFAEPAKPVAPPPAQVARKKTTGGVGPYPSERLHCAQESEAAQVFLQELWEAMNGPGATVVAPVGAELDLVIADVEQWLGFEPPALRISPSILRHLDLIETVPNALTLVDARDGSGDLSPHVEALRERQPKGAPLLVVVRNESAGPIGGLPLITLPPLKERPLDLAFYARRALERSVRRPSLTVDTIRLLLNYPWPGNYHELQNALRRALLVDEGPELQVDALAEGIIQGHGLLGNGMERATLEQYLKRRQADYLAASDGDDLAAALQAAGVEPERADLAQPLHNQPLLYPELLTDEG